MTLHASRLPHASIAGIVHCRPNDEAVVARATGIRRRGAAAAIRDNSANNKNNRQSDTNKKKNAHCCIDSAANFPPVANK